MTLSRGDLVAKVKPNLELGIAPIQGEMQHVFEVLACSYAQPLGDDQIVLALLKVKA